MSTIERPATASGQLRVTMRTRRFAASIGFCNRFANRAQRSCVVPFRFAVITLDTELPPQGIQIDRSGRRLHFVVKFTQYRNTNCAVADPERPSNFPLGFNRATRVDYRAQSGLKTFLIPGALPDLNVSEKAK